MAPYPSWVRVMSVNGYSEAFCEMEKLPGQKTTSKEVLKENIGPLHYPPRGDKRALGRMKLLPRTKPTSASKKKVK